MCSLLGKCSLQFMYRWSHRQRWEELAARRGDSFDINTVAGKMCEESARRARSVHDVMFGAPGFGAKGARDSSSWQVLCHIHVWDSSSMSHFRLQSWQRQPAQSWVRTGQKRSYSSDGSRDAKKGKPNVKCFLCKQWGHWARDCKAVR